MKLIVDNGKVPKRKKLSKREAVEALATPKMVPLVETVNLVITDLADLRAAAGKAVNYLGENVEALDERIGRLERTVMLLIKNLKEATKD